MVVFFFFAFVAGAGFWRQAYHSQWVHRREGGGDLGDLVEAAGAGAMAGPVSRTGITLY